MLLCVSLQQAFGIGCSNGNEIDENDETMKQTQEQKTTATTSGLSWLFGSNAEKIDVEANANKPSAADVETHECYSSQFAKLRS